MHQYIIEDNATILEALKKIDSNHKGFLVVVSYGKFKGTLTDGDIRRAIIRGMTISDPIENVYKKNAKTLKIEDDIANAITIFNSSDIDFLPILGDENRLINILTEKQLETLLLSNMSVNLLYQFESLDETALTKSIVRKPWGFYKTTIITDDYQSKILTLYPQQSISLQRHKHREEYWLPVFGIGEVQIGESLKQLVPGTLIFIPKYCLHKLRNVSEHDSLMVVEVQLGETFDESDIERIQDDYGR